jgi:hypothetical protein
MSLMKVRALEFQENSQNNDSNLGKTFYLSPQFLVEIKPFEQVYFNDLVFFILKRFKTNIILE